MEVKAVCSSAQVGAVTSLHHASIGGWLRAGVNKAARRLSAHC